MQNGLGRLFLFELQISPSVIPQMTPNQRPESLLGQLAVNTGFPVRQLRLAMFQEFQELQKQVFQEVWR